MPMKDSWPGLFVRVALIEFPEEDNSFYLCSDSDCPPWPRDLLVFPILRPPPPRFRRPRNRFVPPCKSGFDQTRHPGLPSSHSPCISNTTALHLSHQVPHPRRRVGAVAAQSPSSSRPILMVQKKPKTPPKTHYDLPPPPPPTPCSTTFRLIIFWSPSVSTGSYARRTLLARTPLEGLCPFPL